MMRFAPSRDTERVRERVRERDRDKETFREGQKEREREREGGRERGSKRETHGRLYVNVDMNDQLEAPSRHLLRTTDIRRIMISAHLCHI